MTHLLYLFLFVVAGCAVVFVDFLIPGVVILLLAAISCHMLYRVWRRATDSLRRAQEQLKEVDLRYQQQLPMARITYTNGEVVNIGNLEEDYKVGKDMKLYIKDPARNKWILQENVIAVEFYIHDVDPVTILQ